MCSCGVRRLLHRPIRCSRLISITLGLLVLLVCSRFCWVIFVEDPGDRLDEITAAGIVVDERGLPVADACITLLPPVMATTTNVAGFFRTHFGGSVQRTRSYVVEIKKPGFADARVVLQPGDHSTLKIRLEALISTR
jgi:hypothetical protein